MTPFEAAQGTLAILLGFGGAWRVLVAHGGSTTGLGVLALLLGALCYGAAFAFAERRAGQGRNFYFYATRRGAPGAGRGRTSSPSDRPCRSRSAPWGSPPRRSGGASTG